MKRLIRKSLATGFVAALVALTVAACNAFGITGNEEDSNEVRVTVQSLGADFLVGDDGFTYRVTETTEYEGYTGFAQVTQGAVVDIEWEAIPNSTDRRALEIEAEGASED